MQQTVGGMPPTLLQDAAAVGQRQQPLLVVCWLEAWPDKGTAKVAWPRWVDGSLQQAVVVSPGRDKHRRRTRPEVRGHCPCQEPGHLGITEREAGELLNSTLEEMEVQDN